MCTRHWLNIELWGLHTEVRQAIAGAHTNTRRDILSPKCAEEMQAKEGDNYGAVRVGKAERGRADQQREEDSERCEGASQVSLTQQRQEEVSALLRCLVYALCF